MHCRDFFLDLCDSLLVAFERILEGVPLVHFSHRSQEVWSSEEG